MDMSNADGGETGNSFFTEDSNTVYLQKLTFPNEILYKVLGYVDSADLLAWRSLSSVWHQITSHHLQLKQVPIRFFKTGQEYMWSDDEHGYGYADDAISRFLLTTEQRREGPFPFSVFEFFVQVSYREVARERGTVKMQSPLATTVERFAEVVGKYANSYSVHLDHFYEGDIIQFTKSLLCKSPNLERFAIYGQNKSSNCDMVELSPELTLPKLKTLVVMSYSPRIEWCATDSDHYGPDKLRYSLVSSWMTHAPALQTVNCGFGIEIKSEMEATDFLKSLQPYQSVQLELNTEDILLIQELTKTPLPSLRTLFLDVESNVDLVFKCLENVAGTLIKLKVTLYGVNNKLPCMPCLEFLYLNFEESEMDIHVESILQGPITPNQFPSLKCLTLNGYQDDYRHIINENWSLFEGVFEKVDQFQLIDYRRINAESWNLIFPNAPVATEEEDHVILELPNNQMQRQFNMRQLKRSSTYINTPEELILF